MPPRTSQRGRGGGGVAAGVSHSCAGRAARDGRDSAVGTVRAFTWDRARHDVTRERRDETRTREVVAMLCQMEQSRRFYRPDVQAWVRVKAGTLVLRDPARRRMELLRQTGERTIDHADVQWCIAGGFVIDSRPDGMEIAVTIMGRDREGGFLHVFA